MRECRQSANQSVLEHGESVRDYLFDILDHIEYGSPLKFCWKIPSWVYERKYFILSKIHDRKTIELYSVYHDCGKPYCKTVDDCGKSHFPNHAEVSYEVFKSIFPDQSHASELIRKDMDIHLLKADQLSQFASSPYAITLLMTGLAEIHSNASMFGGIDSTSFKIKWKQIDKRGKQIMEILTR